jgi:hypothetical protein
MNSRLISMMVAITMGAAGAAQVAADQPANPILGIWRCQMHGLPAVTLTVTDEDGSLTGAVLFYLHKGTGQAETATPGVPEPLFHPSFDGKTLTFEVSHRRAHPPQTLEDAPMRFEVKLDGAGADGKEKAELMNPSERDPKAPRYFLEKSAF